MDGGRRVLFAQPDAVYTTNDDFPEARIVSVSPGFFETFGVHLIDGRAPVDTDIAGSEPIAVVNSSFARKYFQGENPLYRRIRLGGIDSREPWLTIVGVTPDLWTSSRVSTDRARVFVPLAQTAIGDPEVKLGRWDLRFMVVAIKTIGDPLGHVTSLRSGVAAVDSDIPVYGIQTMDRAIALRTGRFRLYARYYIAFGLAALFLGMMGLYGVISFTVSRRTRELGIKIALGAEPRRVVSSVLWRGLGQIGLGVVIGSVVAFWLVQGMRQVLFHVELWDLTVMISTVALLVTTGAAACLVPAMRASRIEPVEALRAD
jgi:hypothetical protein